MYRTLVLLAFGPAALWSPQTGPSGNTVELNGHTFTLPPGFTIELVAGPPVVDRPIAIDFDEQGRLYVTEVSGTNEKPDVQAKTKPHKILRLEATKGDGKFDKRTVFADKMAFPEGIMVYKGSVYVAAPPSIWKLTDTKGTGTADERVEWFQGKTLTGCANDLHGPYLGPDGWIYWCKGAFAQQTYDLPGKPGWKTRAAHIFRARPDGTGVEPVMTGGMDNPVDVVFTPGGERIFSTTFLQYPRDGKRDGLIHAVYGGIYGKEFHDVLDSHPWTGPTVMPILTDLGGAAAPCGLHRYESDAFGKEYKDNIFCCCFNMRKVTRHILVPDGATFKTVDSDFLVSNNPDFHPTDVIEDADGSLLVVDTGGWYKLCCPTTQLIQKEVLGGIYRIRKKGMPKVEDPRGLKLHWQEMKPGQVVQLFDDARPFVRKRAVEALAATPDAGDTLMGTLDAGSAQARLLAVWTATRMPNKVGRLIVRYALQEIDLDDTALQAAIHSAGLWRDEKVLFRLCVKDLHHKSPHIRRAAAEAIGRIGDKHAVPALLDAVVEPCDRVLEHSLIYALIEIGDPAATAVGLKDKSPAARRSALIALDQMKNGGLKAETVATHLASFDPRIKEAAWWIAGRHPDWGGTVADFLRDRLTAKKLSDAEQDELTRQLAKFARGGPVQKLLADQLVANDSSPAARRIVLRAMAQSGAKEPPGAWVDPLAETLTEADADVVQEAIATARAWRNPKAKSEKLNGALLVVGKNGKAPIALRLNALAAIPGLAKVEPALFEMLLTHLPADQPITLRSAAADVLGQARLDKEQLRSLTSVLKKVGPMELDRVLEPYTGASDETVGLELIAALKTASAKSSLRPEFLKPRFAKFGPAVLKQAEELYALLNVNAAQQQAHLEKLLKSLPAGDEARGRNLFNSDKAACFTCHSIGYRGGNIGPDLTKIARIRTDRDLLESVIFPSASFVRGYEPVVITTRAGKMLNGVIKKEAQDEIVLTIAANQEVRVARADIDDIRPSAVSVMPAGYDTLLTAQELGDLLAFLKACK
jgi:putative membrane-bound dehydrogenase-like protein